MLRSHRSFPLLIQSLNHNADGCLLPSLFLRGYKNHKEDPLYVPVRDRFGARISFHPLLGREEHQLERGERQLQSG